MIYPIRNKIPRIEFERSFFEIFLENSSSSETFTTYAIFKGFLDYLIEQFLESLKNCSVFINSLRSKF